MIVVGAIAEGAVPTARNPRRNVLAIVIQVGAGQPEIKHMHHTMAFLRRQPHSEIAWFHIALNKSNFVEILNGVQHLKICSVFFTPLQSGDNIM